MSNYKFETDEFGISESGIHLLRSRFNYQTIKFNEINELVVEKGKQVRNWLLIMIFGAVFFCAALIYGFALLNEFFFGNTVHHFYVEQFVIPVIPFFLGSYMLLNGLKSGLNLKVVTASKVRILSLEDLRKMGELESFLSFLKSKEGPYWKLSLAEWVAFPLISYEANPV